MRVKQTDAVNDIANRILKHGLRHTDGDVNIMLVNYYNVRQASATRRDFSRAIDKVQNIVNRNEQGAAKWREHIYKRLSNGTISQADYDRIADRIEAIFTED